MPEVNEDLECVANALQIAKEHGLEVEVVYSALQTMKDYPACSVSEAISMGLDEWVK